ncbi:hypothetical protein ACHAPU_009184 [Fusarium lateritium]
MATNLSRAATVSASSGYHRRRGSFTADWTDTSTFAKHSFDKRRSRDDLALILKSSKRSNVTAFHVPIHGRLPSPEHSPRTSSITRTTWVRTSTPDSVVEGPETGVIAVGMAIGSPTQMGELAPAPWSPQNRAMNAAAETTEQTPESIPEPVEDTQQKTRKWGLFRSKSKRSVRPAPQRAMTDTANVSTISLASSGAPASVPADHLARRAPKHKPIVLRSLTEPLSPETSERIEQVPLVPVPTLVEPSPASPERLTKEKYPAQPKTPKEAKHKDSGSGGLGRKITLRGLRGDSSKKRAERAFVPPSSPPPMPAIPRSLLDVEIPSIKMDRYSVMFNSVLQPPQPQGQASSLLARRQATLDHLKTVKEAIAVNRNENIRPRRATSPQPSPTAVAHADTSKPLPSPRFRANTTPSQLEPPTPASFDMESPSYVAPAPRVVEVSRAVLHHNKFAAQSSHYQPALVSKFNRRPSAPTTDKVNVAHVGQATTPAPAAASTPRSYSPFPSQSATPASPEHTDDEGDVHVAKRQHGSPSKPPGQAVSPPASITSSGAGTTRQFSPSSSPKKLAPDSDPQEALRNAVEVSIARQISVSRQQRQMLHPLKSNPSVHKNGSPPGRYIRIEKHERLSETNSATPTLVVPRELSHSPDAYQMHRKSERVVLEDS